MKFHGRQLIPTWPEWSDTDLNNERWEKDYVGGGKKEPVCFEDPDGRDWFPAILGAASWKRPNEMIHPKLLCVVENQNNDFDFLTPNKHLIHNELMRLIISQIISLVNLASKKTYLLPEVIPNVFNPIETITWKPWQHVYSLCKAGKVPHQPLYNPWGKYVIRLHWMGCWRKIYVDDSVPISLDGRWLLPVSNKPQELWPIFLIKALLKVASLEFHLSDPRDFSVIEHLTGWMPERIVHFRHYESKFWEILLAAVPRYEWPTQGDNGRESARKALKNQEGQPAVEYNQACVASYADLYPFSDNVTRQSQQMNSALQTFNFTSKLRHPMYINEIRTVPLQAPQSYDEIPQWKLIRRQLWDENYMISENYIFYDPQSSLLNTNKQIKCLGLLVPWTSTDLIDDSKKDPRDREMSTVRNPIISMRMKRDMRKDMSKYCETIQLQWVNYEDFRKCIRSVSVFHKPSNYQYCYRLMNTKVVQRKISTKSLNTAAMGGQQVLSVNDSASIYLFSETLEQAQIFISLSVCGILTNRLSQKPARYDSFSSLYSFDDKSQQDVGKGFVMVETYDWLRQRSIQVVLTLKTAATRGGVIHLPPGRHVLVITTRSSLGSFLTICSNSPFVVGEEEVIFPKISSESLRFIVESERILSFIIESFNAFGTTKFKELVRKLYSGICPDCRESQFSPYYPAFNEAIFILFARVLDTTKLPADVAFALRVFTLLSYNIGFTESKLQAVLGKRSVVQDDDSDVTAKQQILRKYDNWYTVRRLIKLQSYIRRYLAQNIVEARLNPNSKHHKRAAESLSKLVVLLQRQPRDYAPYLFRAYFHVVPNVMEQYPFYSDECNCVLSHDYAGASISVVSTNSWLVVFRDTFHVLEENVKITPCFYCNDVVWSQHVVDNDTLEQSQDSMFKTYQSEYKKNKNGHSVMIRIRNLDVQREVKWSLRMVSPLGSHYAPISKDGASVVTSVKDIEDYYCPRKKNIIARYSIQAQRECVVTIQFVVSSPKVKLEISVYEEDATKLLSVRGKTEIIVPAVFLRKYKKYDESTFTYYVEVRVLHDTWLVEPIHMNFIQALQLRDQREIHLKTDKENVEENVDNKPSEVSELETGIDQRRPFWLLKIIADNNLADSIMVKKDTRRVDEVLAIKKTWEDKQPGRFNKAYNARMTFLQKYGIESMPPSFNWPSTGRSSLMSEKLSSWEAYDEISDMSSLQAPGKMLPELINTKVRLKTWNFSNFVRRLRPKDNQTLKDRSLIRLQALVQKKIYENFNTWRRCVKAEGEQMRIKQHCEKALLYDTHKQWMKRTNKNRRKLLEEREAIRLKLMEEDELNDLAFAKYVEEIQSKLSDNLKKDAKKK